jgi:AAA+ superfamily predicted ATPase
MERVTIDALFERRQEFPDSDANKRLARLVGIDDAKARLAKVLSVLVNPDGPKQWAAKFHHGAPLLLDYLARRPPLVILAGDVGTGKTELAETIGDAVARAEKIEVTLFPMSLSTRGSGAVGEMTQLVSAAFDAVMDHAKRTARPGAKSTGGSILLIDEGDALTQSRESTQMHHEDRAGVNAFIRGIDRLAAKHYPVAVVLCTNRVEFVRPNDEQRSAVLDGALTEAGLTAKQIANVVAMTGSRAPGEASFTYSDLTQRLLPTLVLDAYPSKAIHYDRVIQLVAAMKPTPRFRDA